MMPNGQFPRRLLERLSRRISFHRRLPRRFGGARLRVSPGAALCYYRRLDGPAWRELFDFAQHCVRPGAIVWDVGASMGVFGFAAAHVAGPAGRVVMVEADSWAVELLKSSAVAHGTNGASVDVLCAAVAAQVGIGSFEIPERSRAASHLASVPGAGACLVGKTREAHPVITVTLDWLVPHFGPPGVIKLDVEGAELDALQGASRLLTEHRPPIFVEVYERNADAIGALLHNRGYDLFDMSSGWEGRRKIERPVYNTLALPR